MVTFLKSQSHGPGINYGKDIRRIMIKSIARHNLPCKSLDRISSSNGMLLIVDLLHLNSRGAGMVADRIEKYLRGL
ncbi:MAG TPA: hypothetical protein ENI15_16335 [Spirochaetes bacterium]|nr:hypothetical protein [Spirochaetota bacterium]